MKIDTYSKIMLSVIAVSCMGIALKEVPQLADIANGRAATALPVTAALVAPASAQTNQGADVLRFAPHSGHGLFIQKHENPVRYGDPELNAPALAAQWSDRSDLGRGKRLDGVVFRHRAVGDGTVKLNDSLSGGSSFSTWRGTFSGMFKSGDGSAHSFTANGALGTAGKTGYNELGLFVGSGTNLGSSRGTVHGVEVLVSDGRSTAENHDTFLAGVIARNRRFNRGKRASYSFFASSEGSQPQTAILYAAHDGLARWEQGIDFSRAHFTGGVGIMLPVNAGLAFRDAAGNQNKALELSDSGQMILHLPEAGGERELHIVDPANRAVLLAASASGSGDAVSIRVGGRLKRVVQGPRDSAGRGYRMLMVEN